jgi:hypothetical protein
MEGDGDGDLIYGRLVSYTVLWCKSGYTRCKLGICGVYLHRAVYYTPGLYLSVMDPITLPRLTWTLSPQEGFTKKISRNNHI